MKPWQFVVMLKPAIVVAYVAAIAGLVWLASRLPPGRVRSALLWRLPPTRAVGVLLILLAVALIAAPLTAAYWLALR